MNTDISPPARMPTDEPATDLVGRGRDPLRRPDVLLLAAFCLLLFGFQMFSGRPLSLHEARLPECSREMLAGHNWLFPQSGGRPWLERPPLPQWIEVGVSVLLGQHCDKVWVVRLPAVLAGTWIVLATAWIASVFFGRTIGLLSGFVLATTYELYAYSILAEDDIFLAAVVILAVALFVRMEFCRGNDSRLNPVGNRPWEVWAFFLVLGISSLVKGPLVGAAVVIAPVGVYLLTLPGYDRLRLDWRSELAPIRRYAWLWGLIIFALLTVAWSWAARRHYPELERNLRYDYENTSDFDQPFWYYPVALAGYGAPWLIFSLVGFWVTCPPPPAWLLRTRMANWHIVRFWSSHEHFQANRAFPARFLWCWAIMPVLVLSIPHRKHHHYLVPSLAPWGILAAIGAVEVWKLLRQQKRSRNHALIEIAAVGFIGAAGFLLAHLLTRGPFHEVSLAAMSLLLCGWLGSVALFFTGLCRKSGPVTAAACFVGLGLAYCWGQVALPDMTTQDTLFLHRVEAKVPRDQPLYVNSDLKGEMDFFRIQFYLRPEAHLLHNLTFLRDQDIHARDVWVVTRHRDLPQLKTLGAVEEMDRSAHTRREDMLANTKGKDAPEQRFTLFLLHFDPNLQRYPRPPYIGTLQAMGREPGPWCGPPM